MIKRPNWFPPFTPTSPTSKPATTDIRLIGDRRSGKTAYLASLANWYRDNTDSPILSVKSVGDREAEQQLIDFARDILGQGLELPQTPADDKTNPDIIKNYGLEITLKDRFSWNLSQLESNPITLNINFKDYSGEFFKDLYLKPKDPWSDSYFQDCRKATGILLLIDGTTHLQDNHYARGLGEFFRALNDSGEKQNRRIAFVLSKCELSQLCVSRHEPRELISNLFPKTVKQLENWMEGKAKTRQIDYFTSSAFGSLEKDHLKPNTKILQQDRDGYACIIREPTKWQPFGLVSPIYWLATGHRHQQLDRD
jgi:Double-GTPase 1